ncbi:unnamed protein product [Clonostachys rosea]|uniref:Uncharacterized protein n=1 Tax=Bionectria ochroleuca TaxID=29856 RepID=A0ABY6UMP4_BIOOC|nr:unnamed protein product [Clonostachys rosea]
MAANAAEAAAAHPKKSAWKVDGTDDLVRDTCCRKQSVCGNQCMAPGEQCCDNRICGGKSSSGSMTATSSSSGSMATSTTSTTGTRTATGFDTTSDWISGSTLATDDILSIIQTAVPAEAQTDPASACFLSTDHNSVYTTPDWYSGLPSQAQSYFSSVHATAASNGYCTADAASDGSSHSSSLSTGAIVGAVIGSIAGALILAGLALFALRAGWFTACRGGAAGAAAAREDGSEEEAERMGGTPMPPSVSGGPEMSGGGRGWGSTSGGSYTRASGMSEHAPTGQARFPVPVGSRLMDDEGSKRTKHQNGIISEHDGSAKSGTYSVAPITCLVEGII